VEPGQVRRQLLDHRIVFEGGVPVDTARILASNLRADLVMSGLVNQFADSYGPFGAPQVELSLYVLDRRTGDLVWSSRSRAQGDDGVFFFRAGLVTTPNMLACGIAQRTVQAMVGERPRVPAPGSGTASASPALPQTGAAGSASP
jgi:hypothetical protein